MRLITRLTIGLLLLTIHTSLNSQVTFEKTYGTNLYEEAKSVRQTADGGYVIGGTNLVKIDDVGELEWSKPYPSTYANLTGDGG